MKYILILSIFFFSCKKECTLTDGAGNVYDLSSYKSQYEQYLKNGSVTINGNTYNLSENDLWKECY